MRSLKRRIFEKKLGKPIANASFAMMHRQVRTIEKRGVNMMHTARPFTYYCKVFYHGQKKSQVIKGLSEKTIVDIGCGYTPYAEDSMFQTCRRAGIEFYGVDPMIGSDVKFGIKERLLAKAMGSRGHFNENPPGLSKAVSAYAQDLPFNDNSVDEILCSYLLFVWIEDQETLADILGEFLRVLKPGGVAKLYPLVEWRRIRITNHRLKALLLKFEIQQHFVHGGLDFRVTPSMLTEFTKRATH